ncbi:MAG TPA: glutamate racemase [Gemmatimonadales bacterium]
MTTHPDPALETGAAAPRGASPIGVFDSGIGGLTVAHELMRQMPDEQIVYVGDTARVPYGPKSPETVLRYSREIASFLCEQEVKLVVIACNTATAHALDALVEELPVPVIGVVEPGARAAVRASATGRIGVIGTTGTVRSGAYEHAIMRLEPDAVVVSQPCPLFVPLVEEGWTEHEATRLVAFEYLAPLAAASVDTLVLGCTHYPLLKRLIGETIGRGIRLIDSAEETAMEVARRLAEAGLRAAPGHVPAHRFYATDDAAQMLRLGQRFLGSAVEHVETLALAG